MKHFTILAAALVALMLTTMQQAQAQVGNAVCPTGSRTLNPGLLTVNTPTRDRVTFTTNRLFFHGLPGAAGEPELTSARILSAVVDGNGHPVHYVYFPLGTTSGTADPADLNNVNLPDEPARTFYSLKPNTRYAVTLFADQLKGAGSTPIAGRRTVGSVCFRTAS